MRQAAVDRVRPGLCITLCNTLGLTVDASTARKIAFFQSGKSTYDLRTQKPLDPAKSERLVRILQTGNFIRWFRKLLATRPVNVQDVVNGHGCDKFRAADASPLFELLQAVEAGETTVPLSPREDSNYVRLKTLSACIKSSPTAQREAGERPSVKINAMIETGQLAWRERRNVTGRLTGYFVPVPENASVIKTDRPAAPSTPIATTIEPEPAAEQPSVAATGKERNTVAPSASPQTAEKTVSAPPLQGTAPSGTPRRPIRKAPSPGKPLRPVGATDRPCKRSLRPPSD